MNRIVYMFMVVLAFSLISCSGMDDKEEHTTRLDDGWQLFSSDSIDVSGEIISQKDFDATFGYPVTVPATIVHGLMQNGYFEDIFDPFIVENMDSEPYEVPWWYRKVFNIDDVTSQDFYQITFEGINFKANIWINGELIATDELIQGSYGVWNFDITDYITNGENVVAVEVIPPKFGEDISKGFVDWNPTPPDNLTGLWREVFLKHTGALSLRHTNVVSKVNKETLDEAELTISTFVTNHCNEVKHGKVSAEFDNVLLNKNVVMQPGEVREIFFTPEHYEELKMDNPMLWWPNNMGDQPLYDLTVTAQLEDEKSDVDNIRFGIREVEDFWNESGYRGFKVNGQKLVVRSAGWVDDIFLGDSDEKVVAQMEYAQHLNLNSIRLESFWGRNRTIMNKADELGLLLMLGWTAHWEWISYTGIPHDDYVTIRGEEEKKLHAANYRDQVLWHRHHPSVAIWTYGSDKLPRPDLEVMLNEIMDRIDTTRPILSYCGGAMLMGDSDPRQSEISGPTGVKMEGPYDWVPPVYWYIDEEYGGAFGFNTEVGPGPQIPPLSSIKKMIPKEHLWPIDSVWLYYSGRNQFENLDRYLNAFHARYGESDNLEDFIFKNQIANYEAMRPLFESFSVNKFHSTGVVQWMYNSAWPTFYWQLFDYYLNPTGAFYATRKAAAPLSPIYNYGDGNVYINNDHLTNQKDLKLLVEVFDINSNKLHSFESKFDVEPNSAKMVYEIPEIDELSTTYFLDLKLFDNDGSEILNNFYWLSTVEDIPDFDNTTWFWTPNKEHADFHQLNEMPASDVEFSYDISRVNDRYEFVVELENPTDLIAFFVQFELIDNVDGEPVLPVFWDDNYISVLPGENRVIRGYIPVNDLSIDQLDIVMQGCNL
ncbi:glycoside hydrolase family 2 TIM barrel-domain containing protein [Marinilabiliaceae bacterium ANBcel2]|nr:glycoside hydrolase family 2 TIM barrel-domain containing protein [Marinilabiliaceae bacterium ANBcel2]